MCNTTPSVLIQPHPHNSFECVDSTTNLYAPALAAACTNMDQSITLIIESSQSIQYSELVSCIQAVSEDHALLFSEGSSSCEQTEVKYAGCNCTSNSPQQCWQELPVASECQQVCILWFISKLNYSSDSYFIILPGESGSARVMEMLLNNSCVENTDPVLDNVCCTEPTSSEAFPSPGTCTYLMCMPYNMIAVITIIFILNACIMIPKDQIFWTI